MNHRPLLVFLPCLLLMGTPATAEWRRDNREACERLDEKLRQIQDRRRSGYTPSQGRKLEAQRKEAEEKRRNLCR